MSRRPYLARVGVLTSEHLLSLSILGCFLAAVVFAGIFGRTPERIGAGLLATNAVLTLLAQATISDAPFYYLIAIDLSTFLGLGWLTLTNTDKLWPGLAACAQLLVAMFSVTRVIDFPLTETQYAFMVSVCSMLTVSALAGGTLVTRFFPRDPSEWDVAYGAERV